MIAFHEVALPEQFARAVRGGPVDATAIIAFGGGRETRVQAQRALRRRYEIAAGALDPDAAYELLTFYEARRGRMFGFRLRDPMDHRSCAPLAEPSPGDQTIAVGDGGATTFALLKTYADAGGAAVRRICKPVASSVRVSVDGVEIAAAEFTCDAATGRVTFARPPQAGARVCAGFLFDAPVRFDMDRLDLALVGDARAGPIALIEATV